MTASNGPASSSRRLRFSQRTAIAFVALIALCFWGWHGYRQYQRVREVQDDNEGLRAELRKEHGELKIDDANRDRLHAIAIPTLEPMTWRWRVYVPSGRTFWINNIVFNIPDEDLPAAGAKCTVQPGEQILTVALRKNESTGTWDWIVKCGQSSCGAGISGQLSKWIDSKPGRSSTSVSNQVNVAPGKPLEIIRYRAYPLMPNGGPLKGPTEGILVWFTETK